MIEKSTNKTHNPLYLLYRFLCVTSFSYKILTWVKC